MKLGFQSFSLRGFMVFSLMFMASVSFAQEICNNAIDDDNDGLIDLNDPDCECEGFFDSQNVPSLIPNPSFEDHTCCPSTFTTPNNNFLSCANGWVQATTATSDYQNTQCYTMPAAPVPPPDGNGFVGAIFSNGWQEYVGSCLSQPMQAGLEYQLTMQMAATSITGFGDLCGPVNFPAIDITIFGNPSCNQLPFNTYGCPGGNWQPIGSANYTPVSNWDAFTITFTPTQDIAAIMIGSPCTLPAGYGGACYPYFLFDNLILNETTYYTVLDAQEVGQWCDNDLVLEATSDTTNGTWQWYKEGIALIGETSDALNISANNYGAGNYTAAYYIGSQCEWIDIEVEEPDLPTSDYTTANVCFPEDVTFQDLSNITSGSIVSWQWDFGDNTTSSLQNPTHAYANDGTYNVVLAVTSDINCVTTYQSSVTVFPKPAAQFAVSDGCLYDPVVFTDQTAINNPGAIDTWEWDFGDLNTSNIQNPSNLYSTEGVFDIELIVNSTDGCADTVTGMVELFPVPTIDVSATPDCSLEDIQFTNNSDISTGIIASHDWDFGDSGTSSSSAPLHIFADPGTFTINYTATSNEGCMSDTSFQLVSYPNPVVDFSLTDVCADEAVPIVDNTSVIAPGSISTLELTMGDNSPILNVVPANYQYASSGNYLVTLIAVTQQGCDDTLELPVSVHDLPVADFTFVNICEDDSAQFADQSTIPSGAINNWQWDFGNGNTSVVETPDFVHYPADDLYQVELIVSSGFGCSDTLEQTIEVYPVPIAEFIFDSVCYPLEITFTDISDPNGAYAISNWMWEFSDMQTSAVQSPSMDFGAPGTYSAQLLITNSVGCKSTFADGDAVVHPVPVADFPTGLATCLHDTIFFTDLSTIIPITDDTIDVFNWAFDDGTSSAQREPFHIYADPDLYDVTFTVMSNHGCTHAVTNMVEIYPLPLVDFTSTPNQGCAPLEVQFYDESSIPSPYILTDWEWYLGADTLLSSDRNPFITYNPELEPLEQASYNIGLTVTSGNGCVSTILRPDFIQVYPKPNADFSVDEEVMNIIKAKFEFTDLSTENVVLWDWNFGDASFSSDQHPTHTYHAIGTYPVGLIVETIHGCKDTAALEVRVDPVFTFYIPNSFTPDANGINDEFWGQGEGYDSYSMYIYDRWGELIFESNDDQYRWDGTYKGAQVQEGVYVYYFYLLDWQGHDHEFRGHVTLHR